MVKGNWTPSNPEIYDNAEIKNKDGVMNARLDTTNRASSILDAEEKWNFNIQDYFDEKILGIKSLEDWKTNGVDLLKFPNNKQIVIKTWNSLERESLFLKFVSENWIDKFPKLFSTKYREGNIDLILEFKEWINWKKIVDLLDDKNWETIWWELWESLNQLHWTNVDVNDEEKELSINQMIGYLTIKDTSYFEQEVFNKELSKLKELILKSENNFVMLHWDFSPHNFLFINDDNNYSISAILDPSWRVWYGINYFDIVYLFNTRWNKGKEWLKKWFLSKYYIDQANPLYIQFDKVMKMYLIELYPHMSDTESSKNILNEFNSLYNEC